MASAARKRAHTGGGGEEDEEPVPIADGFEAPTSTGKSGPVWPAAA